MPISPHRRRLQPLGLLVLLSLPCGLGAQTAHPHADASGEMTFALAGDAIITRKLSVYDEAEFLGLREIVQGATAAFVNLEILFHRFEEDVIPASASGGTYMQADPALAGEITWMGFDMVSRANNHTMDYGVGGLRHTDDAVEAVGLMHAGTGENLARGRPGLNPIRFATTYQITPVQMEALRDFREGMGYARGTGDQIRMFGETFQLGDEYQAVSTLNEEDLQEILASVREAKRQANFVIFASHSHERGRSNTEPAEALVTLARAVIDAGADMFVGHGPHVLRGIEIYKGKPIFYSLGDFMFQPETVPFQAGDNYRKYGLGHGLERPQRGRPLLATGALGDKIIGDLQTFSEPFGTHIENRNGVGVVRIR